MKKLKEINIVFLHTPANLYIAPANMREAQSVLSCVGIPIGTDLLRIVDDQRQLIGNIHFTTVDLIDSFALKPFHQEIDLSDVDTVIVDRIVDYLNKHPADLILIGSSPTEQVVLLRFLREYISTDQKKPLICHMAKKSLSRPQPRFAIEGQLRSLYDADLDLELDLYQLQRQLLDRDFISALEARDHLALQRSIFHFKSRLSHLVVC